MICCANSCCSDNQAIQNVGPFRPVLPAVVWRLGRWCYFLLQTSSQAAIYMQSGASSLFQFGFFGNK